MTGKDAVFVVELFALNGADFPETLSRSVKANFGGAQRTAHHFCDLLQRQTLKIVQHYDDPVLVR
ncbi:MAG: hypothetical protein QF368_06835 [SAR202 cluster bacterium]|jgi:hypothetical protein|nr:hypothetical protein [SAR202 cluster bacterium]